MLRLVTFGAGNRAGKYLQWVQAHPEEAVLEAVVDPDPRRLAMAKALYELADDRLFSDPKSAFCLNPGG